MPLWLTLVVSTVCALLVGGLAGWFIRAATTTSGDASSKHTPDAATDREEQPITDAAVVVGHPRFSRPERVPCSSGLNVWPISFAIPEERMVDKPILFRYKSQVFSSLLPGARNTYVYPEEKTYQEQYRRSMFALTMKKAGWDCQRHYEILANGCLPLFVDWDLIPDSICTFLPSELLSQLLHWPGLRLPARDRPGPWYQDGHVHEHAGYDPVILTAQASLYDRVATELLSYTRSHLTCRAMASYIMRTIRLQTGSSSDRVLWVAGPARGEYLGDLMHVGFKKVLGERLVEYPGTSYLYEPADRNAGRLYGRGFSYAGALENYSMNAVTDPLADTYEWLVFARPWKDTEDVELRRRLLERYRDKTRVVFLMGDDRTKTEQLQEFSQRGIVFCREVP